METNVSLDTDALLPPRKRLLAGLKRQNSDVSSPSPPKNDISLNNPFMSHFNDPNLSIEEIVETSRTAAIEATKVAEAAKVKAEEKAAKAAKAFAAAKSALDLVAILSDEATRKEKCLKKSKMKKHVSVEELYSNKNKDTSSCGTDEELARDLHRSINSSPRISKNSDLNKIPKHKRLKLKASDLPRNINISSEIANVEGNRPPTLTIHGNGVVENTDTEGPVKKIDKVMVDLNTSKPEKSDRLKVDSLEGLDGFGKKRGKIKQKKLPLSICSFKDVISVPEDEVKCKGKTLGNNNVRTNVALFCSGSNLTPVERASTWKCQSVKAKQNKVMRS